MLKKGLVQCIVCDNLCSSHTNSEMNTQIKSKSKRLQGSSLAQSTPRCDFLHSLGFPRTMRNDL